MSERKNFADHLCPAWHTAERKHETREQDRREKNEEGHLYSLQLVFSDRGKRDAHRKVGDDEDKCYQQQEKDAALHRYVKEKIGRDQDDRYLDVADEYVWHNFSDEHFTGAGRHRQKIFHRAALPFAGNGQASDHHHCHGQDHAHETRHDVILRNDFWVVEGVNAQVDRTVCGIKRSKGSLQIVLQRCIKKRPQGAERDSSRSRIGCVRLDQQRRPIATQEIAAEIFRNVDHKLNLTARKQIMPFGFSFYLTDEIEISAVLHRVEQRSSLRALVG